MLLPRASSARSFAPSRHLSRRIPRLVVLGAVTITVVAAAACGGKDPYAPVATYDTIATTFTVYPLRAAPPPYGSALDLHTPLTPSVVRPQLIAYTSTSGTTTIAPNFDVAFDLDSVGNILVYPPKLITSSLAAPRTAFQTSTTAYTSLGNAPDGTYQADSVIRVKVGQSVVVQAQGLSCSTGAPFYAKFVVDSISALTSALYLRATIDQNCGFKSFAAGLPTS